MNEKDKTVMWSALLFEQAFAPNPYKAIMRRYIKERAIEKIKRQPFFHSPRRRWTAEEIAEYERGHKERTRKALERIEARREWRP